MKLSHQATPDPKRPNVLFLFADQHRADVFSGAGHPDVLTPNLDALAGSGVRFDRAYCQDAICVASRCSLFSGRYPRTLGCLDNGDRPDAMKHVTSLPSAFRANGYRTAAFGKRHTYLAIDEGWDIRASHLAEESPGDNYVDWIREQGYAEAFARDWAAEFGHGPEDEREIPFALMSARTSELPDDFTMEAWTKRRTVEFLKNHPAGDQPFFCFASFYRPHQPYTPLRKYYERFDRSHWGKGRRVGDGISMHASLRQPVDDLPPLFRKQHAGQNRIWRFDLAREDEQIYRDGLAAYYALIEEIDDHVGILLQVLDETGLRENTIVIYASDHGDFVGAHGMIEKCARGHNIYEDTLRVPLFVSWPDRIAPRRRCGDLVELVDLYPTLAQLCGLPSEAQDGLEGASLAPWLLDGRPVGKPFLVSENWSQSTVITDRYKLGVWNDVSRSPKPSYDFRSFGDMLFDREKDPLELRNLAGWPEYAEIEAELRAHLRAWRA